MPYLVGADKELLLLQCSERSVNNKFILSIVTAHGTTSSIQLRLRRCSFNQVLYVTVLAESRPLANYFPL